MTWLLGAFAVLMLVGVGFSVAGVIRHELDLGRIKRNVRSPSMSRTSLTMATRMDAGPTMDLSSSANVYDATAASTGSSSQCVED